MKPAQFPEQNTKIDEDRDQLPTIPAHIAERSPEGLTTTRIKLTITERLKVLFSGIFYQTSSTYHQQYQHSTFSTTLPLHIKSKGSKQKHQQWRG